MAVQNQPGQIVHETQSQETLHKKKKELVEWLKVQALSSSPSKAKKKTKPQDCQSQ
jgi:hypothetical protein